MADFNFKALIDEGVANLRKSKDSSLIVEFPVGSTVDVNAVQTYILNYNKSGKFNDIGFSYSDTDPLKVNVIKN